MADGKKEFSRKAEKPMPVKRDFGTYQVKPAGLSVQKVGREVK